MRRGRAAIAALALAAATAGVPTANAQAPEKVPPHIALGAESVAAFHAGHYDEAIAKGKEAVALSKRLTGAKSSDTADQLWNVGKGLESRGDYAKALDYFEESRVAYEANVGPDHVYIAEVSMAIARCHANLNDAARAREMLGKSLAILEAKAKTDAESKFQLGRYLAQGSAIYDLLNDRHEARVMLDRAVVIFEERFGADHPQVAGVLSLLGRVLYDQGDYEGALKVNERIERIYRAKYGDDHAAVAIPLAEEAAALQSLGRYAEAQPKLERALALSEKNLGPNHARTSMVLHSFCAFAQSRGDVYTALEYCRRAVASRRAVDADGPRLAESLGLYGHALYVARRIDESKKVMVEALNLRRRHWPADHPMIAEMLEGLARIALFQQNEDEAREFASEALGIRRRAHGVNHVLQAEAMALLVWTQPPAERFATFEALATMRRQARGEHHPKLAETYAGWAQTHLELGQPREALALMTKVNAIRERNLTLLLGTGSELNKLQAVEILREETGFSITLHLEHLADDPMAAEAAYEVVLQRKGRVMDALAGGLGRLRARASADDRKLLDELSAARAKLAAMTFAPTAAGTEGEAAKRGIAVLEAQESEVARLDRAALDRVSEMRVGRRRSVDQLRAALDDDAALVDIVVYEPYRREGPKRHYRYAAYVVTKQGPVRGVDLGPVPEVDRLAVTFQRAVSRPGAEVKEAARAIDARVMAPVRALLGERTRIFLTTDRKLSLVPFAAFVDEQGRFLVERYRFTQLSNASELGRERGEAHDGETVLMGAPAFGDMEGVAERGLGLAFPELPAAEQEVVELGGMLHRSRALVGEEATEGALKALERPRVLHLATHGFFIGERGDVALASTRGVKTVQVERAAPLEQPLLRSGLAWAGANRGGADDGEDGVLTALEAASLDLRGTELVVLSACETGLGETHNGNGVAGLRRALHLAGAETQVMSLWRVDDEATRELMVGYYAGLARGTGRSEAMRAMQRELMARPDRQHPYFWAAFIVSGQDGPLDLEARALVAAPAAPPPARGCGCEVVGPPRRMSAWWLLGLAGLGWRRARRWG